MGGRCCIPGTITSGFAGGQSSFGSCVAGGGNCPVTNSTTGGTGGTGGTGEGVFGGQGSSGSPGSPGMNGCSSGYQDLTGSGALMVMEAAEEGKVPMVLRLVVVTVYRR